VNLIALKFGNKHWTYITDKEIVETMIDALKSADKGDSQISKDTL
jgi:hypothetical protein